MTDRKLTKSDIRKTGYNGDLIDMPKEQYMDGGRTLIQDCAGEFIDSGESRRAQLLLLEVQRLDKKFNFQIGENEQE